MDGVDERQRVGLAGHGHGTGDVVDGTQGVGGRADRQETRAVIGQAAVQVVPVELAGLRDHLHPEHADASLALEGTPGVDVGVMVQLGDDHGIARPERPAQGAGQVEGERRHVGAEGDLVRRGVEEVGEGLRRASDRAASVSALAGNAQWVLALCDIR